MAAQTAAVKAPLRRSFSEHVKDSTNKAWDVFWRSVRERRLCEIEVREACDWLRAAGFPQYVQLFKDAAFPIDMEEVKHDHHFLDKDALDSLCRRLSTLNRCVETRLEPRRSKHREDDHDEEDFCTISPHWSYDRQTRRWRRLDSDTHTPHLTDLLTGPRGASLYDITSESHDVCSIHSSSSTDSDSHRGPVTMTTNNQETSRSSSRCSSTNKTTSPDTSLSGPPSPGESGKGSSTMSLETEGCSSDKTPRKTSSSLLRRMEKLRPRRTSGGGSRSLLVHDEEKLLSPPRLQAPPHSRGSSSPSSPPTSSSSQSESSSAVSTPSPVARVRSNCRRSGSSVGVGGGTTRNKQNHVGAEFQEYKNQLNNNNSSSSSSSSSIHDGLVFHIPHGHKPGTFPTSLTHKHTNMCSNIDSSSINWRTGSFHGWRGRSSSRRGTSPLATGGRDPSLGITPSPVAAPDHRLSVYDNMPDEQQLPEGQGGRDAEQMAEESEMSRLLAGEDVFSALDSVLERINNLQQLVSAWSENLSEDDCQRTSSSSSSSSCSQDSPVLSSSAASPCPSSPSHIHLQVQHPDEEEEEEEEAAESREEEEPQTRSLQHRSKVSRRHHWSSEQCLPSLSTSPGLQDQSVSQFVQLQKHALLKLTTLMDKYNPSSKQGWSWTVPKPLTKTRAMEMKSRQVFGVPLLLSVQQTGETFPPSILRALVYLRTKCLHQVGLFRKSGLRSRIQYLRELVESDPDAVSYSDQSAYDVADMVKQYFRDLPEPIFTSRLCETFLHSYQYFPKDQQLVAAQAAILLLPDENRDALRILLLFLRDVVARVDENQMTPTNIAVCLAPSLFHLHTLKRNAKAARSGHRKYSLGRPDQRDLSENLAATQGLSHMITEAPRLFQLPEFWPGRCRGAEGRTEDAESEEGGGEETLEERRNQLQQNTKRLLMEISEKSRDWEKQPAPVSVDLSFKKVDDGCPLGTWRGSVEVDAPQRDVLHRLLREQELWEGHLRHAAVVQTLSQDTDVYHYVLQSQEHSLASRAPQEYLVLRTWQMDASSGPLYLSCVSTQHAEVPVEGVRAQVHSCLYLLEPSGARKTRLTHLCRTDARGHSLEWHSRVSGHLLSLGLLSIRDSFSTPCRETQI